MNRVRCWQVDAFTSRPFGGNPAAVCWLTEPVAPSWMQSVAMEMNLSETAFVLRRGDKYDLRWFTPTVEVDLCGHATLATAHTLWSAGLADRMQPLRFETKSGLLTCRQAGEWIELDFPALPVEPAPVSTELVDALGIRPVAVGRSKFDLLAVLPTADDVRQLQPDFARIGQLPVRGVIVTARHDSSEFDMASRFFAPAVGVDEDPVCGSAHCALACYWGDVLDTNELMAEQVSARGGILKLKRQGNRVSLGGKAVTVWQGELLAS